MSLTENISAGEWKFTPEVAKQFDNHVAQSVPFYNELQKMIAELSDWLLPEGGYIADLGASTGTTVAAIAERHPKRRIHAYLYDIEQHMLDMAQSKLGAYPNVHPTFCRNSIVDSQRHTGADLTVASLTLQFLSRSERMQALQAACKKSKPGGALILIEKVIQSHSCWEDVAVELTQERKAEAGLTDQEIRKKQASIRGVLRPQSTTHIIRELNESGWGEIDEVWRWHNWIMLVAKRQE